jgi:hypothetical protein
VFAAAQIVEPVIGLTTPDTETVFARARFEAAASARVCNSWAVDKAAASPVVEKPLKPVNWPTAAAAAVLAVLACEAAVEACVAALVAVEEALVLDEPPEPPDNAAAAATTATAAPIVPALTPPTAALEALLAPAGAC